MKRKKLRWVADRWASKFGTTGYCIIDLQGVFEACAVKLDEGENEVWVDTFKTKRAAIAACERHAAERMGK